MCKGVPLQAYTLGLLDATGLQHVCMEAATDLRRARARYAIDNVDWAKCVRQLNKDIKTANQILADELKVRIGRDTPLQVMLCQSYQHCSRHFEPPFKNAQESLHALHVRLSMLLCLCTTASGGISHLTGCVSCCAM